MRATGDVLEQYLAIQRDRDRGVQFVAVTGKCPVIVPWPGARPGGFAEKPLAERQGLVRADDKSARPARRYRHGFLARQQRGDPVRRQQARSFLHRALIDLGRDGFEIDAGMGQQHLPRAALRRQDQRKWSAPEGHSGSFCRCRSATSFRIAAAVSSIDRRVTSSSAQLNLALNRRANATSSVTAWRSI